MTVIGVGRDITWFLVSSPAVMRKNAFPDALTQWDGHRPLEEVYCAVTQSRPVAEEYGDQAQAHDRRCWRGSHAPASEPRQSYAGVPGVGRISHRTGCLGTAQGMFPAQVNETTSRQATLLRSELNGQAAWAATKGSSRKFLEGRTNLASPPKCYILLIPPYRDGTGILRGC